jgi:OOP family OmpA-OmpF porin
MKKIALIALLATVAAAPAFAGDVYVVGSVGRSAIDVNKGDLDNAVTSAGATGLSSSLDKNDTAYKVQIGYQFNQNFALEGGYVDLGKANYSANYTGGNLNAIVKASGLNIVAVGILPLNESFSIFGKVGVIHAKVEVSATGTGPGGSASASDSSTDWKPNFGIGGTYNISKQLGIRAEYERFQKLGNSDTTGEANVDLLSAGVMYKF